MNGGIDDAYAQQGAANMVIAYMNNNGGEWPRDWDSLRPFFNPDLRRVGGWSFEHFRSRVYIDFGADARLLRRIATSTDAVTFDVIHSKGWSGTKLGDGPNSAIHRYLRATTKEGQEKVSGPKCIAMDVARE